jgi:hypothetical protein
LTICNHNFVLPWFSVTDAVAWLTILRQKKIKADPASEKPPVAYNRFEICIKLANFFYVFKTSNSQEKMLQTFFLGRKKSKADFFIMVAVA